MCGIVYVHRKDNQPAYKSVLKRYRKQKSRGQQGFGYVAIKNGQVVSYKRSDNERDIVRALEKETADEILFHHRMPTSTPNVLEAAHPILVEDKTLSHQYFVAHNGVIRNDDDLKEKHEAMGIKYTTELVSTFMSVSSGKHYELDETKFNDSESLAIETALALEGLKKSIETEGSAAVVGIETEGKKVINRFFFRNITNPLYFTEDKTMTTLLSIGHGAILDSGTVFKIKSTGGFEKYREGLQAPSSYKGYTAPQYPTTMGARKWDPETMSWIDKDTDDHTLNLPDPFDRGGHFPYNREDDFDYANLGDSEPLRSVNRILEETYGAVRRGVPVHMMTYQTLWDDYYKYVDTEDDLKQAIIEVDSLTEEGVHDQNELSTKRRKLQEKLDVVTRYVGDLTSELTKRESERPTSILLD